MCINIVVRAVLNLFDIWYVTEAKKNNHKTSAADKLAETTYKIIYKTYRFSVFWKLPGFVHKFEYKKVQ